MNILFSYCRLYSPNYTFGEDPQVFEFQALAFGIFEQGIMVMEEDVMYNWTNSTKMIVSSFEKPFCVGKKMHPLTLEASIKVRSKPKSFFVDFATSTGMYCYKHSIVALDFNSRIPSNLSTKFAFLFFLLNSNKLMTPLPM